MLKGGHLALEGVHLLLKTREAFHLLLQALDVIIHLLVFVRVLEIVGAAVGCIEAGQVEVATPLAGCLAIALDLATLAFVAIWWGNKINVSV